MFKRAFYWFALSVFLLAVSIARAGTWQPLTNQPPMPDITDPANGSFLSHGGASFPMLLTDGTVIVQNHSTLFADSHVLRLTPDINGSYLNGTWSAIAPLPYIPTASAQAVLPDGRVMIAGGEFTGVKEDFTLTNRGAIYDPFKNKWTSITGPPFFQDLYPPRAEFAPHPIGDSACVILADGTLMLQDKMSRQAALFNPTKNTWKETGTATKADLNDEEGWTLLPNGKVLTVDCYSDVAFGLSSSYPANPTNSEIYDPQTGTWSSAGSTVNTLTDPSLFEIGPAVLRPDGSVFALGSQGYTSIYFSSTGAWVAGPRLPVSGQGYQMTVQDGPGALLPNGNVLFAASGGPPDQDNGYSDPPAYFFEFDGQNLVPEAAIPNSATDNSGAIVMLILPTGQILEADSTLDVEIYTAADTSHNSAWEPVITQAPSSINPGKSYVISGMRFNGMSQGSAFGDECQNATNYPLVRLTNLATNHVVYCRTHDHTSMAVASNNLVSTTFDVPSAAELGTSKLEVVANGIASQPVAADVAMAKKKKKKKKH